MCDFVKVFYTWDNEPAEVPITFFENVEQVKDELLRGVVRTSYKCFWSSNKADTPELVKDQFPRRKICDAEEILQKIKARKRKMRTVTGYYNVHVEKFAGTLQELRSVDDPKGRRRLQPNTESLDDPPKGPKQGTQRHMQQMSREHNLQFVSGKESKSTAVKELDNDDTSKECNNLHGDLHSKPLTNTINLEKRRGLKRKSSPESSFEIPLHVLRIDSESQGPLLSDIANVKADLKMKAYEIESLKAENNYLKERLLSTEAKCQGLQENFHHVAMNMKWQDRELNRESASSSKHHERSSNHKTDRHGSFSKSSDKSQSSNSASSVNKGLFQEAGRLKKISASNLDSNKSLENSEVPEAKGIKVLQIQSMAEDGVVTGEMIDCDVSNIEALTSTATNDVGDSHNVEANEDDGDGDEQDPNHKMIEQYYNSKLFPNGEFIVENNFSFDGPAFLLEPALNVRPISQEQYDKISKVKAGEKGDSLFVKRLCDLLWTREELGQRSASGLKCPNQPESKAREACEPEKKGYMRALLTIRVIKDLSGTSSSAADVEKRVKRLNKYITSKIKTVRTAVCRGAMPPTYHF